MVQSGRPGSSGSDGVSRRRIIIIGLLLMAWMLVIIIRLAWVQVVDHDYYVRVTQIEQRKKEKTDGLRGSIIDRNGRVLAMSAFFQSVLLDQVAFNEIRLSRKEEKEGRRQELLAIRRSKAINGLAGPLEMSPSELASKLVGTNKHLWLKRKLQPEQAEQVRQVIAGLPGIRLIHEMERTYPNQELAAHLLGYLGVDGDGTRQIGRAGIEKRLETQMTGKSGETARWVRANGTPVDIDYIEGQPGLNVRLTINAALQRKIEYLLRQAVERHGAKGGGVVVMDPESGEVHALASYPTFDPNRIDASVVSGPGYVNQPVMSPYEPGSIFKIITYAAAIDQGIVRPEDLIDCGNGQISIGPRVIRDTHSYGELTVEDSFAKSSNVGAIRIAQRLGRSTFHKYITGFGFGKPTGIELPAESSGIVHAPAKWRPDSIGSVAIGQEISVTLVQAVRALAVIANGGYLVTPHLILGLERPMRQPAIEPGVEPVMEPVRSESVKAEPLARRQVITEETARQMRRLMEKVVTHGTGRAVRIDGYTVAGKTGTPQKSGRSGYGAGQYMPSFLGFAPATKPRFAIVVMIDEPSDGNYYGGVVAAPVFSMVAEAALSDNEVMPDETDFRERLDQLIRRHVGTEQSVEFSDGDDGGGGGGAESQVLALIPPAMVPASNPSGGQSPPVATRFAVNRRPSAVPPSEAGSTDPLSARVMPNLRGVGMKAAMQVCNELKLKLKLNGNGVVMRQSPPAGAPVRPGGECRLELGRG
ncbi:MAG: hypothetical protein RIR52_2291 [Acidobacteriota bacterium]